MSHNLNIERTYIILAAGKGSRLYSSFAKGLHEIGGKKILKHLTDTIESFCIKRDVRSKIIIVVGHKAEQIVEYFSKVEYKNSIIEYAYQDKPLGTADALKCAMSKCDDNSKVMILPGDMPFISIDTLGKMLDYHIEDKALTMLTVNMSEPYGYGRVLKDSKGNVIGIVEEKDANSEQKKITEVNVGVMCIDKSYLEEFLPKIDNNNVQGEYYLTDLISILFHAKHSINCVALEDPEEVYGVNTMSDMARVERYYYNRKAKTLMSQGVRIIDDSRIDIRGNLSCGIDVILDINTIFVGEVNIKNNVKIGANSQIRNVNIGDNVTIGSNVVIYNCVIHDNVQIKDFSHIEGKENTGKYNSYDVEIGDSCIIGPFARIRSDSVLNSKVKIGNFVEIKNTEIADNSKVNHLSYIGDASIGKDVNIGAGSITCNYDGFNKLRTNIGNSTFIGSNTTLVAPVSIEDNVYIAAGSTITESVDKGLAIGRARQVSLPEWKPKYNKQ